MADTLAALADDPGSRASVREEIQEALVTELWEGPSDEWRALFEAPSCGPRP